MSKKNQLRIMSTFIVLLIIVVAGVFWRQKSQQDYQQALEQSLSQSKQSQSAAVQQEQAANPVKLYGLEARKELESRQLNANLILQRDERFAQLEYGHGDYHTLDKNGCAIVALSMINAYFDHKTTTPNQVLDWAQNRYFTDYGTSWQIFDDFAKTYGYHVADLTDNLDLALSYLKDNIPVVISVNPGKFTKVGHIMVLTSLDNEGKIHLLDPNDDETKKHSLTAYTPDEIKTELKNMWVFT
ncbi:C39 family peptidase [Holzapfeliella sp. He02]|uniref:C39 family peptidase n=1 Tax=Holzapfeliella saturejae TaxID=3082953 RepID=A0ABU8SHQ8_9LACO